ncbi:hypothetical protein, variant [Fonticula alba]|uniref:Uncharacterized protein n=1 Tax=Fonticula alba TaxID=691883 RepID=A0A058ZD94_FONAL|nr:hypothetical protein, variant [Fonticula alba]KCV71906.1 hypothetical protein, variant [Fonticula alba]|eukprot:XP_009493483.1 hypothetical protein, variant [Fonticula alba]
MQTVRGWTITRVDPEPLTRSLQTIPLWSIVAEASASSGLLRLSALQQQCFSHLRRVRRLDRSPGTSAAPPARPMTQILLCQPTDPADRAAPSPPPPPPPPQAVDVPQPDPLAETPDIVALFRQCVRAAYPPADDGHPAESPAEDALIRRHVRLVNVPRHAPVTLEQYRDWTQTWPLVFHSPRKGLVARAELDAHQAARALGLLEAIATSPDRGPVSALPDVVLSPDGSFLLEDPAGLVDLPPTNKPPGSANAAILVDPLALDGTGALVAGALDRSRAAGPHFHPLGHAVIACLDAKARRDIRLLGPRRRALGEPVSPSAPATPATSATSALDPAPAPTAALGGLQLTKSKAAAIQSSHLCNGLDLYVLDEPCIMYAHLAHGAGPPPFVFEPARARLP